MSEHDIDLAYSKLYIIWPADDSDREYNRALKDVCEQLKVISRGDCDGEE